MTDETEENLGAWKDKVIDALVICGIYNGREHEENPAKALSDLLDWHWKAAQFFASEEKP